MARFKGRADQNASSMLLNRVETTAQLYAAFPPLSCQAGKRQRGGVIRHAPWPETLKLIVADEACRAGCVGRRMVVNLMLELQQNWTAPSFSIATTWRWFERGQPLCRRFMYLGRIRRDEATRAQVSKNPQHPYTHKPD